MADLLTLIGEPLKRVASTHGGEYAGPCPFCGGTDRFRAWPEQGRWWCRQCGRGGDAVDLVRQRDGLTYRQALAALGRPALPAQAGRAAEERNGVTIVTIVPIVPNVQGNPGARPAPEPPCEAWQAQAAQIVAACEAALWADGGAKARQYLAERGLREPTLRAWHIGYHPRDGKIAGLYVPRGIVIPGYGPDGALRYVKVRRPVPPLPGPKYQQVAGGRAGLFGADHLAGRHVAVICEGELDALLLWQAAHDLADVVALGSASTRPDPALLTPLLGARHWLLAGDRDAAGERAAETWGEWSARVVRARPLQGNDLTDFWRAGGDLRAWLADCLARLERAAQPRPPADVQAQAEMLLAQDWRADPAGWAQRWAALAQAAGWPCWGTTWAEWAGR